MMIGRIYPCFSFGVLSLGLIPFFWMQSTSEALGSGTFQLHAGLQLQAVHRSAQLQLASNAHSTGSHGDPLGLLAQAAKPSAPKQISSPKQVEGPGKPEIKPEPKPKPKPSSEQKVTISSKSIKSSEQVNYTIVIKISQKSPWFSKFEQAAKSRGRPSLNFNPRVPNVYVIRSHSPRFIAQNTPEGKWITLTIVQRIAFLRHGTYTIPSFDASIIGYKIRIPGAEIQVAEVKLPKDMFVMAEVSPPVPGKMYVGQFVPMVFTYKGHASIGRSTSPGKILGNFHIEATRAIHGFPKDDYYYFKQEALIGALKPGDQQLEFKATRTYLDPTDGTRRKRVTATISEAYPVKVVPLPIEGQPQSFNGAVGFFEPGGRSLRGSVFRIGDPLTYVFDVEGKGNFVIMKEPDFDASANWRFDRTWSTFRPGKSVNHRSLRNLYSGKKQFYYSLIPVRLGHFQLPTIRFSFFDLETERYVEHVLLGPWVNVVPIAGNAQAGQGLASPASNLGTSSNLSLGLGLSFWNLQALIGACIFSVLAWKSHQLYCEGNPEYTKRLRARFALMKAQRQFQKAAQKGHRANFFATAQIAIRAAVAISTPGPFESLVWLNIDPVLKAKNLQDSDYQTLRTCFLDANQIKFGVQQPSENKLQNLAGELKAALKSMRHSS